MKNRGITVLFVDDDTLLGNIVTCGLQELGYKVHYQSSLVAIESVIGEIKPNIIVLDVEIGDKNGIEDSAKFRASYPGIPIIFVSSHTDSSFVVKALDSGGVIYIKKPIDLEELSAYITRHATANIEKVITLGNITLNTKNRMLLNNVTKHSQQLNRKEFELLKALIENQSLPVSREEIISEVWGSDNSTDSVINNYIAKLRSYLSDDSLLSIETLPREGYRLTCRGD